MKPLPKPTPAPTPSGQDLLTQVLEMADLLMAAVQELATERRLERTELAEKRATLGKLEQAFSSLKDPGYLQRR